METALRFFSEEDALILSHINNGTRDLDQLAAATDINRDGLATKLQSFRAWKLVNLKDEVTQKGRDLLDRRLSKNE